MTTRSAHFNGDGGLCLICLEDGFAIYHMSPFKEAIKRNLHAEVLFGDVLERTNFVALVLSNAPDTVRIYDDSRRKFVVELPLGALGTVTGIRLRRDRIIVALHNQVLVYSFAKRPILLQSYDTADNLNGLLAVSLGARCILAFPGRRSGYLQAVDLGSVEAPTGTTDGDDAVAESLATLSARAQTRPRVQILHAHEEVLARICMSRDGTLIATASRSGTLIRIWRVNGGEQVCELRRGADKAEIMSMAFNPSGRLLAVTSDKGTMHVFHIDSTSGELDGQRNRTSFLTSPLLRSILPKYFASSWSAAQIEMSEPRVSLAWPSDDTLVAVSSTSNYWRYLVQMRGELTLTVESRRTMTFSAP